jgi:glycosyltransferase involved in cell wall biosynthesis
MKILHLLNHVRKTGNGIVNVATDLACLQAKQGHEVAVASSGGDYISLFDQHHVQHITLDQTRTPLNLLKVAKNYIDLIHTFQPDVVHAHMITGTVLAAVFKGFGRYGLVSTVHNEFQKSSILMGLADRVLAVSDAVAESMRQRGVAPCKLRVVRNGTLGSPRTEAIHQYAAQDLMHPAIVTISGMYRRKGIADLIQAFEQVLRVLPDAHLYLVGDGPDRDEFEKQAQVESIGSRIHFEGFQAKPQSYLRSADVFVLASHQDPCPLVISEAREAGCAIVASRVDGIPELLDGGIAGILVPPRDPDDLAAAIIKLLTDPSLLKECQEQAQKNLQWLSAERVADETLTVYQDMTETPKPSPRFLRRTSL